jgi:arsenate reductase (thioredoxin)
MLEFTQPDAPVMDFIITVCDQSRGEACPVWPGQPVTAHWGMADPSTITDETEQQRAFSQVQHQFVNRIRLLDSLPIEKLDKLALTKQVKDIAEQTTIVADTE